MIIEELIEEGNADLNAVAITVKNLKRSNKIGGKEGRTKEQKMRKEKDKQKERERE